MSLSLGIVSSCGGRERDGRGPLLVIPSAHVEGSVVTFLSVMAGATYMAVDSVRDNQTVKRDLFAPTVALGLNADVIGQLLGVR